MSRVDDQERDAQNVRCASQRRDVGGSDAGLVDDHRVDARGPKLLPEVAAQPRRVCSAELDGPEADGGGGHAYMAQRVLGSAGRGNYPENEEQKEGYAA